MRARTIDSIVVALTSVALVVVMTCVGYFVLTPPAASASSLPAVTHLHAVYDNDNFGAEWDNSLVVTHVEVFFDYQLIAVYGEIESYGQADSNFAAGSVHHICVRPEDGIASGKMKCVKVTVP